MIAKRKPVKANGAEELELRRWCIEQAIRWPERNPYAGAQQQFGVGFSEADILGRAERIYAWVHK